MSAPDRKPGRVVRPYGLIGGRYEVDATGLLKYRLAWIIAIAAAVLAAFQGFGLPNRLVFTGVGLALVAALLLCINIARTGKRL